MTKKTRSSALAFLDSITEDTPKNHRASELQKMRMELARAMKRARKAAGKTQKEIAGELGVSQSWISNLENATFNHQIESVLSYALAFGGDVGLGLRFGNEVFQVRQSKKTTQRSRDSGAVI